MPDNGKQIVQRSRELFGSGCLCAESVLLVIAESRGIAPDWIPGIATGFCSGVARTCGMCGAVSGAIMAIGLLTAKNRPRQQVDGTYDLVRKLMDEFKESTGSTNCRDLTGCDLGTPEGQKYYRENKVRERCDEYVGAATGIVLRLLEENDH